MQDMMLSSPPRLRKSFEIFRSCAGKVSIFVRNIYPCNILKNSFYKLKLKAFQSCFFVRLDLYNGYNNDLCTSELNYGKYLFKRRYLSRLNVMNCTGDAKYIGMVYQMIRLNHFSNELFTLADLNVMICFLDTRNLSTVFL